MCNVSSRRKVMTVVGFLLSKENVIFFLFHIWLISLIHLLFIIILKNIFFTSY
jgi:hypothetical protein